MLPLLLIEGDVDKMAALDWRVVPLAWREALASPGRKLKVQWRPVKK